MVKDSETSHLDGEQPSQVLVDYDRPVCFQVQSLLFYGLLWGNTRYLNTTGWNVLPDKTSNSIDKIYDK